MNRDSFLQAVLGEHGYKAVCKATVGTAMEKSVLPKAIDAWVELATRVQYQGPIPSVEGSEIRLEKMGDNYIGLISIGEFSLPINGLSKSAINLVISQILVDSTEPVNMKKSEEDNLEKSVGVLVKFQFVKELQKAAKVGLPPSGHAKPLPALPAGQNVLSPSQGAVKPNRRSRGRPKAPKVSEAIEGEAYKVPSSSMLTRSESSKPCVECGSQMFKGESFVGCQCTKHLAKMTLAKCVGDRIEIFYNFLWKPELVELVESLQD
jgi:hypothetical protein